MHAAILGLGEAGATFAGAFADSGWTVSGFDPAPVETPAGVVRAASAAEAVADAHLVMSLTAARFAVGIAHEVAGAVPGTAVYIDLNAASPETKRRVAGAFGSGALVVDGAVLGSVQKFGAALPILLSGPGAERAAEHLRSVGASPEVLDGEAGAASRRKLLRSTFVKGLAALIAETMDIAESAGDAAWIRAQAAEWLTDGTETIDRLSRSTKTHALRRSHELADSLAVARELGQPALTARGAYEAHLRYARQNVDPRSLVKEYAAVPTAAIGDVRDRMGVVAGSVGPVWDAGRVVGRAFTVNTRPGDNKAFHEAIDAAEPGDVLVVAGGGEANRALMGELMAERAALNGIAGIVVDGAVRDAAGIEELGLPVWAVGVTPAGPYRHGPGHLQVPVSVGGVVCMPGDLVVADADGVVVVPALDAERTLEAAKQKLESERAQSEAAREAAALRNRRHGRETS